MRSFNNIKANYASLFTPLVHMDSDNARTDMAIGHRGGRSTINSDACRESN